jgi:hypothetical protein
MPEYSFDEALSAAPDRPSVMIAIDDAMCELEHKDPRKTKLSKRDFWGVRSAEIEFEWTTPWDLVRRHAGSRSSALHTEEKR